MDEERTTTELLQILEDDYQRCYKYLMQRLDEGERDEHGSILADYEFEARQLFRAAFACIEGATYILKIEATFNAEENGVELLPQEQHFIFEADFTLNNKGQVVQRSAKIPLSSNIRFAFDIFAKANGIRSPFDPSLNWWSSLRNSIRVRDRLMHPRAPGDLDVSPKETTSLVLAKAGFDDVMLSLLSLCETKS